MLRWAAEMAIDQRNNDRAAVRAIANAKRETRTADSADDGCGRRRPLVSLNDRCGRMMP